ncbi:MAG: acyl-CoA reductase [Myxococcota bacterium]|nr:acyl-CoA reductase [Myxococcota bacterium]
MIGEAELRDRVEAAISAGAQLRARPREEVASLVAAAWGLIADPERAPGRAARERLPETTGLSLPMIAWALRATFEQADEAAHLEAARRMTPAEGAALSPARLSALILAGNVFTACVQPCSMALLAGSPLIVKASSKDDVLPQLFVAALAEIDLELAEACEVVTFPGGTPSLESALMSRADVVSVYGSDATLTAVRQRLSPTATLVPHGHGLGVGLVPRGALGDEAEAAAAATAFALDVAAYDQRGCMSPHVIWVERGGAIDARRWASMLATQLGRLAEDLPRGALPADVGAAQIQWRGVAAARGELHEGDGWAVSYEGRAALRISPGWRNVMVLDLEDARQVGAALGSLGVHLKTLGVAGDAALRRSVAASLPPGVAPRVAPAGRMQRPSLLSLADGRPPWEGLFRLTALE